MPSIVRYIQGYLTMTDFDKSGYVYLDPQAADSESDAENDEHGVSGVLWKSNFGISRRWYYFQLEAIDCFVDSFISLLRLSQQTKYMDCRAILFLKLRNYNQFLKILKNMMEHNVTVCGQVPQITMALSIYCSS